MASNHTTTSGYYDDLHIEAGLPVKLFGVLSAGFAILSLLAIACTTLEAWADHKKGKGTAVTHIQLAYQVPLFLMCVCDVLGTVPAPRGSPGVWGARGNEITCEISGFFFLSSAFEIMFWDGLLSIVFLLMVKYNWQEAPLRKMVAWCHVIAWPFSLGICTYFVLKDWFNVRTSGNMCYVYPKPDGCVGDECFRGAGSEVFLKWVLIVPITTLLLSAYVMTSIYLYIRKLENNSSRYAVSRVSRHRSCAMANKGMLYSGTFFSTVIPSGIQSMLETRVESNPWVRLITCGRGLIGFCNMLVFLYNRQEMHTRYGRCVRRVLQRVQTYVCCCCCCGGCCSDGGLRERLRKAGTDRTRTLQLSDRTLQRSDRAAEPTANTTTTTSNASPNVSSLGVDRPTTKDASTDVSLHVVSEETEGQQKFWEGGDHGLEDANV